MKPLIQKFNSTAVAVVILLLVIIGSDAFAQPSIQWQKSYGGTGASYNYKTIPTNDGGYIMIGETKAHDGDVIGHSIDTVAYSNNFDVWVVKTDSLGNLQWQKCLGGRSYDAGSSIIQTSDGGYMVCGITSSIDGDVSGNHGATDAWLVKLNNSGSIQWQKCYGGTLNEKAEDIVQTVDGGYIVAATSSSTNGDVIGNHGNYDVWIIKVDSLGSIKWNKCYGGSNYESLFGISLFGNNYSRISIKLCADSGYVFSTGTASIDGDVIGHHGAAGSILIGTTSYTNYDFWVVKLDTLGTIKWQKTLGGYYPDFANSIIQTSDKGYIATGYTLSNDGDVLFHHPVTSAQRYDSWTIKLSSSGTLQWQKTFGGSRSDIAFSISQTSDNGYFITGNTQSNDGDIANGPAVGGFKCWNAKTDSTGNIQWQKNFNNKYPYSSFQTNDGGYIVGGKNGRMELTKLSPVPTNVITGNVFEDLNANCVKDANEVGLQGKIIKATPGNYYASTDANGNYTLFVDTAIYNISHIPSTYYNNFCPTPSLTYTTNINSLISNSYNNDFGDTLNAHCADLWLSVGTPFFRKCFKNNLSIYYYNNGSVMATNVNVSVKFDSLIIPLSSSIPWSQVGNVYNFTIDTLLPGQYGNFTIIDSVSCGSTIGLHNACVIATIQSPITECNINNNVAYDCHYIVGSCDPNAKEIAVSYNGFKKMENGLPTDTLSYMIRFQNTGTFAATSVIIRDTLPSFVDPASVEVGAASHPFSFRIYGQGILEWTFDNIVLPDSSANELASHGFVKFNIKQKANNPTGTIIKNFANIIFDYNNAVLTDTAVFNVPQVITQIAKINENNNDMVIYPNPNNGIFNVAISLSLKNSSLKIFNITGELVFIKNQIDELNTINLENQASGLYFIQISNNNYIITSKISLQQKK